MRICSVTGCGKRVDCHGFCASHARRMARHGSPFGGTTNRWACVKFIENVVLQHKDNTACLRWPFGANNKGYGVFHVNRKAVGAHQYICDLAHGPRPSPRHEVAHSCGKGHELCVNPHHLRWATRRDNHADKIAHGTVARGEKNPRHKLSSDEVPRIRLLLWAVPQHEIARQFGVCQMSISHIATGRTWGWLQ